MPWSANEAVRAYQLRERFPVFGRCENDIAKNNAITYFDIPGLQVYMEADTTYVLDGYIGYTTGATPGIRFVITAPEGASGNWGFMPIAATGPANDVEAIRKSIGEDPLDEQGAGGATGGLFAIPHGIIRTAPRPGPLTIRFAQLVSAASATIVETGSWIRITKVA